MKLFVAVFGSLLVLASSEDPFLEGSLLCKFVDCPEGTACGPTGECVPNEFDSSCAPIMCTLACEHGFQEEDGCPICSCKEAPPETCLFNGCPFGQECDPFSGLCVRKCPLIRCMLACENGFKFRNGCPICACQ